MEHPDLIEGHARFSDAGVFRLRPDLALVQTVDFFPPLVDDPREYGRIAAANSLSDVYAMGGAPLTVLNVAGFPSDQLEVEVLAEIFAGGAEKVIEAGAVVVGGHTVTDTEIKYGLAVTGVIDPKNLVSNSGARPGDALVLTKPLGMGSISTAIKKERAGEDTIRAAVECMSELNRAASEVMVALGARGATDITGFGLLGHAREMAEASQVTLRIDPRRVPLFPGALDFARRGIVSGGAARNASFLGERVDWRIEVEPALRQLLYDSETSGGLLIALPPQKADELVRRLRDQGNTAVCRIGEVVARQGGLVVMEET
jgi:selenide,water dikinase